MGAFEIFMLSMQVAGLFAAGSAASEQKRLARLGGELDQAAIESNLEAVKVQSLEQSVAEMDKLRKNLGAQLVIQAARGTSSAGGTSAFQLGQASIETFNKDERARRINLLAKEATLRAGNVFSSLRTLQSETQIGQRLTAKIFNTLETGPLAKKAESLFNTSPKTQVGQLQ